MSPQQPSCFLSTPPQIVTETPHPPLYCNIQLIQRYHLRNLWYFIVNEEQRILQSLLCRCAVLVWSPLDDLVQKWWQALTSLKGAWCSSLLSFPIGSGAKKLGMNLRNKENFRNNLWYRKKNGSEVSETILDLKFLKQPFGSEISESMLATF